jgi:hypothetical protein
MTATAVVAILGLISGVAGTVLGVLNYPQPTLLMKTASHSRVRAAASESRSIRLALTLTRHTYSPYAGMDRNGLS